MVTVKELIKKLKKMPPKAYVAIDSDVSMVNGNNWLMTGELFNMGAVESEGFLDFDDMSEEFKKNYDENNPWVTLQ